MYIKISTNVLVDTKTGDVTHLEVACFLVVADEVVLVEHGGGGMYEVAATRLQVLVVLALVM